MPFEEERQVRRELVDVHPARQVVLDEREPFASVNASCETGSPSAM